MHGIALSVRLIKLSESKHIVQVGIKALDQQVGLNRAKLMVEIGRKAEAVRTLLLQVVCQDRDQSLATHYAHMQVFIESLWRTESASVGEAQVNILCRVKAEVGTRREDDVVHLVVLVQSATQEEAPLLVLPLVLEEETAYAHILFEVAVVAEDNIFQAIKVILCAKGKV